MVSKGHCSDSGTPGWVTAPRPRVKAPVRTAPLSSVSRLDVLHTSSFRGRKLEGEWEKQGWGGTGPWPVACCQPLSLGAAPRGAPARGSQQQGSAAFIPPAWAPGGQLGGGGGGGGGGAARGRAPGGGEGRGARGGGESLRLRDLPIVLQKGRRGGEPNRTKQNGANDNRT